MIPLPSQDITGKMIIYGLMSQEKREEDVKVNNDFPNAV